VSSLEILITTIGMALIVLGCRAFFVLPKDDLPMPLWLRQGLGYAPVAALAAVVTPELFVAQGHLVDTWRDARIPGALAGLGYYAWRRGLFGTIVIGTGVMLALRFGWGW
jgi:branched-subunit amino acid transport protein